MEPANQNIQPEDKDSELTAPKITERIGRRSWIKRILGFHSKGESFELSEKELGRLEWELEKHLSLFKDYSDLAVKAVGIFAAVVGGILSISFTVGGNADVKRLLLQAAYIMSLIMCGIFFMCGLLWFRVANEAKWIGKRLDMIKFPDIIYLSYLLWLFSVLFFLAAIGLNGLKDKVL